MADGVPVHTDHRGPSVATDDVDGQHYQRIKIAVGEDGEATDVTLRNPLPIENADHTTLSHILDQLKIMNIHLSVITGLQLADKDAVAME